MCIFQSSRRNRSGRRKKRKKKKLALCVLDRHSAITARRDVSTMALFDGSKGRLSYSPIHPPPLLSSAKAELGMDQSWETDPARLSPNAQVLAAWNDGSNDCASASAHPCFLSPPGQIRGSDEESTANETIVDRSKASRTKLKRNRKGRTPLAELADEVTEQGAYSSPPRY